MMQWRYPLAALAGICLLSGCQQEREPSGKAPSPATESAVALPAAPILDPAYDREMLIVAVMQASSDAALGRSDQERQRGLDGKRFELRLRFGCAADKADPSRSWTFDEKRRELALRVEPEITGKTPLVQELGDADYEAVEGFWIRRPWMLAADCPAEQEPQALPPMQSPVGAVPKPEAEPSPPQPRIGLAQFFTQTDPRTHRRNDRAYAATKVLGADLIPSAVGYDLVVSGRLRALANGSVISCIGRGSRSPPDCIVSAQFDSVAIEQPSTGETIAKWSSA